MVFFLRQVEWTEKEREEEKDGKTGRKCLCRRPGRRKVIKRKREEARQEGEGTGTGAGPSPDLGSGKVGALGVA